MLRFISIIAFLTIFFTVTIPIVLIVLIIGIFNRHLRDVIIFKIVKHAFGLILRIAGVKLEVSGQENIPSNKAVLFIGNHTGFFDVVSAYYLATDLTGFIAKKEFIKIPGLNWWMYLVNCLFLDREDPRAGMRTIQKAAELIKNGVSIFVFPEGTRSRTGEMGDFKEGSFRIATKTKCPIIPVAYQGSANAFENQFPRVKPCTITITYGEPIYTEDLSRAEQKHLGAMTKARIQNMLNQNQTVHTTDI